MRSTNSQANLEIFSSPLGSQKMFLPFFMTRHVGVHAAAVDADDGLGQEAGGHAHGVGHLAADQLVELDLVGGGDHFAVAVVDFKLRRARLPGDPFRSGSPWRAALRPRVSMKVRSGSPGSEW